MRLAVLALLTAGCATARAPMTQATGRDTALDLVEGTIAAARECQAVVDYTAETNPARATAISDACVRALIPAHDAVTFLLPTRWTVDAPGQIGCAGFAVRTALERVSTLVNESGFVTEVSIDIAIRVGRRVEGYAYASCDPLHPTTEQRTFIDPHVANVEPSYPGP